MGVRKRFPQPIGLPELEFDLRSPEKRPFFSSNRRFVPAMRWEDSPMQWSRDPLIAMASYVGRYAPAGSLRRFFKPTHQERLHELSQRNEEFWRRKP